MNKSPKGTVIAGLIVFAIAGMIGAYWLAAPGPEEAVAAAPDVAGAQTGEKPVEKAEIKEREDISLAFCDALADEDSYKTKNLDMYSTLIPGKDGWVFRTNNDFRKDWGIKQRTLSRLLDLQSAMRAHNAELVILVPPVRGMVHAKQMLDADRKKYGMDTPVAWMAYERFIKDTRHAGLNIVGINRREVNDQFYYKRNHHWTALGAHVAAQKAAWLAKQSPIYAEIPKISYESRGVQTVPYKSSFEKAFQQICGTDLGTETAYQYETVPAKAAADEKALFAGGEPQVFLLGTSNSIDDSADANFAGFLKEFLSADVHNFSFTGAGIETSIMAFLNSDYYKNDMPKIVIWEVPGYYVFDEMNESLLSQIVPAAHGDCSGAAVASATFKDLPNNGVIFSREKGAAFSPDEQDGPDHDELYLRVAFTKPMKNTFSAKFHYREGDEGFTKLVKFRRSDRYPADGEFYTLFPQGSKNAKLSNIKISLPKKMESVDVSMQLCALPRSGPIPVDESM